jgi:hypothetical protein
MNTVNTDCNVQTLTAKLRGILSCINEDGCKLGYLGDEVARIVSGPILSKDCATATPNPEPASLLVLADVIGGDLSALFERLSTALDRTYRNLGTVDTQKCEMATKY